MTEEELNTLFRKNPSLFVERYNIEKYLGIKISKILNAIARGCLIESVKKENGRVYFLISSIKEYAEANGIMIRDINLEHVKTPKENKQRLIQDAINRFIFGNDSPSNEEERIYYKEARKCMNKRIGIKEVYA